MTTAGSICRSCSAPIDWRDGANGKRVPVDVATGESHFKSCPDARTWSRKDTNGSSAAQPAAGQNRDHAIARMSALRSAAIFVGHYSKLAAAWLKWLEED